MSGIAGLVDLNGGLAPADILAAMSAAIAHMGLDGRRIWQDGPAGLVYAHLQTTVRPPSAPPLHGNGQSPSVPQPHSLDDQVWLVADARIDDQAELRRRLEAAGQTPAAQASDADLILHAYHAWGDRCLDHLIGDFAFALWDRPRRRLLCARDPLGLRPLFYARAGRLLAFGSHLDAIRAMPGLSTDLDDQALADFLLFGFYQEAEATPFRHIRRLPPAHALVLEDGEVAIRRYWSPPFDEPLRLARREEYIERFLTVFDAAVADRLRATRVSIHMSGGLDSTSVAATALAVARQADQPLDLRAFVIVYDRLIPDVERSWTTAAASRMGIPLEILVADDYQAYAGCLDGRPPPAEPSEDTVPQLSADLARMAARHSPIVLTGQGGDVVFYPERDYLLSELRQDGPAFWPEPLPLGAVYVLDPAEAGTALTFEPLHGAAAAMALIAGIYPQILYSHRTIARDLDDAAKLAQIAAVRRLTLPHGGGHLDDTCRAIVEDFRAGDRT